MCDVKTDNLQKLSGCVSDCAYLINRLLTQHMHKACMELVSSAEGVGSGDETSMER